MKTPLFIGNPPFFKFCQTTFLQFLWLEECRLREISGWWAFDKSSEAVWTIDLKLCTKTIKIRLFKKCLKKQRCGHTFVWVLICKVYFCEKKLQKTTDLLVHELAAQLSIPFSHCKVCHCKIQNHVVRLSLSAYKQYLIK